VWIDTFTQNAWILGENVPGVRFRICQSVEVVAGPDKGARGILISLYALVPEPEFHLETDTGGDVVVAQSHLQATDAEKTDN
jgi:hypothetical protein